VGCGCGGGAAAKTKVTKYTISDDPNKPPREYLTEHQAKAAKANRQLAGDVVPVTR
jgi:hypothetical protein